MQTDDDKAINERLFGLYESNSKNFLKVFGIILGIGLFFLLTVIFPYFFNVYEQNQKQTQIQYENESIQKANENIGRLEDQILKKSQDIRKVASRINDTNSLLSSELSEVRNRLSEAGVLISKLNDTSTISRLGDILNTRQYEQNATFHMAFEFLKAYQKILSAYTERNQTLSNDLRSTQEDKESSEKTLSDATRSKITLEEELKTLAEQWKEIKSPFGNLPIDFANLVAIFPLSLTSGFVICSICLTQATHTRGIIHSKYETKLNKKSTNNIGSKPAIHTIAPLWVDPANPHQKRLIQFLIFLIPLVIFAVSVGMILYSWSYAPSPPFAAASFLSINIYYGLYAAFFCMSVYSYFRTLKELKQYRFAINSGNWGYFLY